MWRAWLVEAIAFACSTGMLHAASQAVAPGRRGGEVVLFDAGADDLALLHGYTARWRKGSDLAPVHRLVEKDGREFVEISYEGRRGMACSTIFVGPMPKPQAGREYAGIKLFIDYGGEDYPKLSVNIGFRDGTALTKQLTLDRGFQAYEVREGFRRARTPPEWGAIAHVMLNASVAGFGQYDARRLRFRLLRIAMVEAPRRRAATVEQPRELFGSRLFCPKPKRVVWKEGRLALRGLEALFLPENASERTKRTASLFAEGLRGFVGRRLPIRRFEGHVPPRGMVLRLADAVSFGGRREGPRREGYSIVVEGRRAVLTGFDEPGLFYATTTFLQLVKQPMRVTAEMAVPCVEILDWPDLPVRLCRLEHTSHFKDRQVGEKRGIGYLIEWVDRFVAGNKLNLLMIDLSAVVRYRRRPEFNGRERLYSLEDLRRFGEFCRDRFVDLCPAWQVGSHATWWLLVGYHPELRERGWASQADVTHPDHDPIVLDCMEDVIDALRPRYLSPKLDEWWHKRREGETPSALLRGKSRAQAFLDECLAIHRFLKQRGITMAVFHDMLTPYHNGTRFGVYKVLDRLPRDIVVMVWSGHHPKLIRYFADRGFRVWVNATGTFFPPKADRARLEGYGKGLYSFGQYSRGLLDRYDNLTSHYDLFRAADFAWNIGRDDGRATRSEIESGRLVALREMFAATPNPFASEKVVPLDISRSFTHPFAAYLRKAAGRSADLPAGVRDVGNIPMRLAAARRNCLVLREGAPPAELPLAGRFSSLVFLHAALVDRPDDPRARGAAFRAWPYGWPLADYLVRYADGSQATLPVRLGMNIKRLDCPWLNRATLDDRYVWTLGDRGSGQVHLFQWEWVNPRPRQPIAGLLARHAGQIGASLLLVAVSGREVRAE